MNGFVDKEKGIIKWKELQNGKIFQFIVSIGDKVRQENIFILKIIDILNKFLRE